METVLEYAGWEIVSQIEWPEFVAIGFHDDGSTPPLAVAGDEEDIADDVEDFSGGWVLLERDNEEYVTVDGTDDVVGYGGDIVSTD